MKVYTIGVYGATRTAFFDALEQAGIDVLLDIRLRRAVRGPQYAYANAQRLIAELMERGIAYRHVEGLAPDAETLAIQSKADAQAKRRKSERTELDPKYVARYVSQRLNRFDFPALAEDLRDFRAPVLMCIERIPQACHRSLAAPKLAESLGAQVVHLIPEGSGFEVIRAVKQVARKRAARRKRYG